MAIPKSEQIVDLVKVEKGTMDVYIKGESPLIFNSMAGKAMRDLIFPQGRKTTAEKASSLKHYPEAEFRWSADTLGSDSEPTYICLRANTFKASIAGAAVDIPGSTKAQVGRLVWVVGDNINVYGIPKLFMSVVRNSDANKTPDVRTRAILPEWCCKLTIEYTVPLIRSQDVANLLVAGGQIRGVGDYRPEKGKGSYGRYVPCAANDSDWLRIMKHGGRKAQMGAMANPECYDSQSRELLDFWHEEVKRRGFKVGEQFALPPELAPFVRL